MSSETVLEVRNLCTYFFLRRGIVKAVDGVTFDLRRGEVLGVVGESGSGKTTLARCLALLERPDAGTVILDGEDLTVLSPRALRQRRRSRPSKWQQGAERHDAQRNRESVSGRHGCLLTAT